MSRIIITVDGLASSGKSSLSRELAKRLGYFHFSSGLVYRALGFSALREKVSLDDPSQLLKLLQNFPIEVKAAPDGLSTLILAGGQALQDLDRVEISDAASAASRHPAVRNALLEIQRQAFGNNNMVAEGRDMGTVVFPEARLKFFITANPEIRVSRREAQFKERFGASNILKQNLDAEITERDKRDTKREVSPTVPASDAIIVDNSYQTLTEVVDSMYHRAFQIGLASA